MKHLNLSVPAWPDYELIDSGLNRKLERFGKHVLIRPETQALWKPAHPEAWRKAESEFRFDEGKGFWHGKKLPETWELAWEGIRFTVRLTNFKHTGIFPEQAANWAWLRERVKTLGQPNVLNLFGYTGIASIAAAQAGARVTHVDASKQSNTWGRENAERSGLASDQGIRWITDDALKFSEREVRRGASYEGIVLDPPAFGRGPKGEVWRIEEDLPKLLEALHELLAQKPGAFFLLNGYAAGYAPESFLQAAEGVFGRSEGEFGELHLEESGSGRCIPSGIYVRFVR